MTAFVWYAITVTAINTLLRILCLATGTFPQRTSVSTAVELGIGICVLVWAVVLVSKK